MKIKKKHVDLSAISHYLKCGQYPDGLSDSDKRGVRKRSKDFRLKDGALYFVRDPRSGDSSGGESDSGEKTPSSSSDLVWRKVLHQPEIIRKAFLECHVDDQGNHRSYDKTLKEFSDLYYLAKTIETVRTYIKECPVCQAYRHGTSVQNTPAGKTPSEREEHVAELMAALPFSENIGEVITHFWQKVEVDLFGPYKVIGGNLAYVVICLDSYSLWPEAKVIEYQDDIIPVAEILHFILSLVARYGMMHTLTFRKESFSRKDINGRFDLLTDEENTIDVEFGGCQDTDVIWKDLECDIGKFAKNYPRDWSKCIDLCLMPHRISRPEMAEYTPAFLVHNREPRLPTSISHRQANSDLDPNLTEVQMRATQSRLMKASKALSEIYLTGTPEKASSNADSPMLYYSPDEEDLAEPATPLSTPAMKDINGKLNHSNMDTSTPLDPPASSNKKATTALTVTPTSTRSKKSVTIAEEKSTKSQRGRGASTRSTRRRTQENTETEIEGGETENDEDDGLSGYEMSSGRRGRKKNYSDVVNRYSPKKGNNRKKRENRDVPLDDYYSALKLYVQHKRYPAGIKDDYKRVIRKMAQNYVIEKDVLYYKSGSKLKKTVMDELERFKLLKEAHVLENGTHLGRFRTLARLNDYYWKGMTVDALALVKTCPVCEHGNERRKSEGDPNPAQESFLNLIKEADAEPAPLKEEAQIKLYECLKQFLVGGNKKTANMTAEEIEYAEKESASYKLSADGLLYHIEHQGIDGLRKVIMTAAEKQKILTEIHILRTGIHRGVERTKAILHGNYFWVGMNRDLKEYLEKCCLTRVFPEDKKQKSQEDKLAKFAEYFMMDMNPANAVEDPTNLPSSDKEPENILTSVGLKEKTPNVEVKSNSLKTSDNRGNDDAMEEALVEAAQAAEANVAASANCLETADIAEPTTTITVVESITTPPPNTTSTSASEPDTVTITTASSEIATTDSVSASSTAIQSESQAAALTEAQAVDSNVVDASEMIKPTEVALPVSEKVVKTYSEVACNTEDSDVIDDLDDSEEEDLDEEVVTSKGVSGSSVNTMIVVPITSETGSPSNVNQTPKVVRSLSQRVHPRRLNDELKKDSKNVLDDAAANDMDEVQSAVNNLKSEVDDIEMPDDVATLTSMIQRRQTAVAGENVETPVTTVRASSSVVSLKRNFEEEEEEEGELEEGEVIKEECVSLNPSLTELGIQKGVKKVKGKRGKRKKQLACSICGALFGGPVTLQIHMSTHSGQKPFGCEVCGKRFTERKYVRIHMRRHTGEKPYLCSICGKGFPRTQSLQSHMMVHEKGVENPQKCEVCNRPFASENRLRAHMEAKHPAVPKVYKCAECNRVFTAMRSLKRHIEAHMGLKRYECQHCGRRFLRKEYLRSHASQHTGEVSPLPKRKKTTMPCPQLKITVGSNTYSVFTSDAAAVTPEQQETWVAAELVQNEEQVQDPNETARATESVEQSVEAPLFFIAPNQVEYEVECTSSGGTELTEADLTAINILAQATLNTPTALPLT